ncbi:hypothetical protein HPB49_004218 [Dermacentor silvarum]|uniref:Uncharacterized protein n=1 Tax=Dermacentor silvarum TaxID=543639 RepID=A0ACB8CV47_DERSI|nr:hypothetical protein HPB49_004218 [Dermacentor silvarum]
MKEYTDVKRSANVSKIKKEHVRVRKPGACAKVELAYSRPLKAIKQLPKGAFKLEHGRCWNSSKLALVSKMVWLKTGRYASRKHQLV